MLDFNIYFALLCNILLSQCIVASVLAQCCYLYLWETARNNVYFHYVPFLNTSKFLKQNKTKQKLPFFSLTELLLFPSPFFCCLPSKFLILPADLLQLLVLCFHPNISHFLDFSPLFLFLSNTCLLSSTQSLSLSCLILYVLPTLLPCWILYNSTFHSFRVFHPIPLH